MSSSDVRDTFLFLRDLPEENCLGDVMRVDGSAFQFPSPPVPVIVQDSMGHWPAMERWHPHYLKQTVGSRHVSATDMAAHNPVPREFDALIDAMTAANSPAKIYMPQICLMRHAPDAGPSWRALAGDIRIPPVIESAAFQIANLWIASHEITSSLHFDPSDNFLAVVRGVKAGPVSSVPEPLPLSEAHAQQVSKLQSR
jgi:hypothetical protein